MSMKHGSRSGRPFGPVSRKPAAVARQPGGTTNPRLAAQTRRLLAKHYINRYRVRRG